MASKKKKWWILLLVAVILALIAAAYFKAKAKPKGKEVTIEEVERRNVYEKVTASGKIYPEVEVNISSDVSGEIVELYVEEGDSVVTGQLLAKIDPDTYISAVERGRAALNNAKSNLAMSESQIENSRAQVENIKAQLTNARRVHERNVELKKEGVISDVEYDQSLSNLEALQANLRAAEASLVASEKSADAARFSVKSSEASLKELQTSLRRTTIKAPSSGIISSLSVEQGERVVGTIQMTGTEMMRIANLNDMEVQVEVSENDILRVENGDSVDIEVDAYLDKMFKGVVTQIANSASNISSAATSVNTDQVTNFIVKVRINTSSYENLKKDGTRYPFRPGMSATVDIYTESANNAITVPIQAVTVRDLDKEDNEENFEEVVFTLESDTASMVKVETGIQDDEYIVINAGLEEGQEVVTGPYNVLSKRLEGGDLLRKKNKDKKDSNE